MLLFINQPLYSTGPFSSPMKFSDLTVMTGKAGKKNPTAQLPTILLFITCQVQMYNS